MVWRIDIDIKVLLWLTSCFLPPMGYRLCGRKAVISYKNAYRMGCRAQPLLQLSPGWHCQGSAIRSPSLQDAMEAQTRGSNLCCHLQGPALYHTCALRAVDLNNRSIFRAFNFLVVPGPAGTKKDVGAIRLHCLGGFQGDHGLLGLKSPLSSPAPWCEVMKALVESFRASLPILTTMHFLSKPPVIVKRGPRFACISWSRSIYFGSGGKLRKVSDEDASEVRRIIPYGIQNTPVYWGIYHLML